MTQLTKETKIKTTRRSGSAMVRPIDKLSNGEYRIVLPSLGWFTHSRKQQLINILRREGFGYFNRDRTTEE